MIRAAVCDDNQQCIGTLTTLLTRLEEKYHYEVEIEEFSSGRELIEEYDSGARFDLLYIDIEMEDVDGVSAAGYIRQLDNRLLLIYVSSHEEYLKELFETEPFRFLSKPVDEQRFEEVFCKAMERIVSKKNQYFYFQSGKQIVKLPAADIVYVESSKRKVIIHTALGEYEYYDKLDAVEEKLKEMRFVRIHQAYLVNMDHIEAFQYDRVALSNGTILSISEKNRPRIREMFWDYCREDGRND